MKKLISLALALCLILALCVPALAAPTSKTVQIFYRGIKVMIDGGELVPVDGDGNKIEPFIIDGTTYMPLRAVAAAFGLGVDWDNATSTAILTSGGTASLGSGAALATTGSQSKTVYYRDIKITLDGAALTPKDSEGNIVEPFIMDDTTYLPLRAIATALGKEVSWDNASSTAWLGKQPGELEGGDRPVKAVTTYYDRTEPLVVTETYEYNELGQMTRRTAVPDNGEPPTVMTCEYNSAGLLCGMVSEVERPDSTYIETYAYTYGADGLLSVMVEKWVSVSAEHPNDPGFPGNYISNFSHTYTYVKDAAGRVVSRQDSMTRDSPLGQYDETRTEYEHDTQGRLISEADYGWSRDAQDDRRMVGVTHYVYDDQGRLAAMWYSYDKDAAIDNARYVTEYTYA